MTQGSLRSMDEQVMSTSDACDERVMIYGVLSLSDFMRFGDLVGPKKDASTSRAAARESW